MADFNTALGNVINRTALLYEIDGQNIGFLPLDATISESHTRTSSIPKNEVEDGTVIADNVVLQNERFEITGLISEAPFSRSDIRDIALQVQNQGFEILQDAIGSISSAVLNSSGPSIKRIVALKQLENFWGNKIPFTVLTGLKKYDNVLINEITIPVGVKDGGSLRFTVRCESIRVVESRTITVPEGSTVPGAVNKQNVGKQTADGASDSESEQGSILFNAFGLGG